MDRAEHDLIFEEGIEVKGRRFVCISTVKDVEETERILLEFSKRFGEEAVLTYWVQPYGGPVMHVKIQRRGKADRVHHAYESGELREVCPQLGIYRDIQWCAEEKARIADPSKRTSLEKIYPPETISFLRKFYSRHVVKA